MEGSRGVDLADGEVSRRLLADEDVDAVVGLLADEGDEAQEQLRVRPHGGKLQEEKMSMESLLTMNIPPKMNQYFE